MLSLAPGDVFERDFEVIRPLSEGGMGQLWVVRQISTGKKRALKLMLKNPENSKDGARRFAQEARVGSLIESEHIVEVIAAGVDEASNTPWLIMELLEGEDLSAILDRKESLPPSLIHDLFQQLCHALGAAHDLPVVHRDLKPENIFLARSRVAHSKFLVKLLDFGIAKVLADGASSTGSVGTPLWMPPEQAKSKVEITPAADVWSLGLIAFNVLAGKVYWLEGNRDDDSGDVMALLREVLFEELPPASQRAKEIGGYPMPDGFDDWFAMCMKRDPRDRFPNAREAWKALAPILKSMPDYGSEHEFTLRTNRAATTTGDVAISGSDPTVRDSMAKLARTAGPVSISQRPRPKFGIGAISAGIAGLFAIGLVIFLLVKPSKSNEPAQPTATVPVATTTTVPSTTPTLEPAVTNVPSATTSAHPTTTQKPTARPTTTTTAPTTTTTTTTTSSKPANPLNMGIQ